MHKLLTLNENKVVVDINMLLIPEFKDLYDEYESMDLKIAAFTLLYFLYDPESPYMYVEEEEREDLVKKDVMKSHDDFRPFNNAIFLRAREKARKLYETPTSRLLASVKASLDKISNLLYLEDLTTGKDGNMTEVLNIHKNLNAVMKNFKSVEAEFFKETAKSRGNSKMAKDLDDGIDFM